MNIKKGNAEINRQHTGLLSFVSNLLDEHGWPTHGEIDYIGGWHLFTLIQHANVEMQKKYYPMIKAAYENGTFKSGTSIAMFEDRIAINQGNQQIYGTQWCYDYETKESFLCPIGDIEQVDERRAKLGMDPLRYEYQLWNWDYPQYMQRLPELRKIWERDKKTLVKIGGIIP